MRFVYFSYTMYAYKVKIILSSIFSVSVFETVVHHMRSGWNLPLVALCQHSKSSGFGSILDFDIRCAQLVL